MCSGSKRMITSLSMLRKHEIGFTQLARVWRVCLYVSITDNPLFHWSLDIDKWVVLDVLNRVRSSVEHSSRHCLLKVCFKHKTNIIEHLDYSSNERPLNYDHSAVLMEEQTQGHVYKKKIKHFSFLIGENGGFAESQDLDFSSLKHLHDEHKSLLSPIDLSNERQGKEIHQYNM